MCLSSHSVTGLLPVDPARATGRRPRRVHRVSDVGHWAPNAALTSAMKAAAASSGLAPPSETLS